MPSPESPDNAANSTASDFSISNFFNDAYNKGLISAVAEHPKEAAATAGGAVVVGAVGAAALYLTHGAALEGLTAKAATTEASQGLAPAAERLLGEKMETSLGWPQTGAENSPELSRLAQAGFDPAGKYTLAEMRGLAKSLNLHPPDSTIEPDPIVWHKPDVVWHEGRMHFTGTSSLPPTFPFNRIPRFTVGDFSPRALDQVDPRGTTYFKAFLEKAMARLGIKPDQMIMVGDNAGARSTDTAIRTAEEYTALPKSLYSGVAEADGRMAGRYTIAQMDGAPEDLTLYPKAPTGATGLNHLRSPSYAGDRFGKLFAREEHPALNFRSNGSLDLGPADPKEIARLRESNAALAKSDSFTFYQHELLPGHELFSDEL